MRNNNKNLYPIFDEILNGLYEKDTDKIEEAVEQLEEFDTETNSFQFCVANFIQGRRFENATMILNFLSWINIEYEWDNITNGNIYYIPTYKDNDVNDTLFAIRIQNNERQIHTISVFERDSFQNKYEI